MQENNTTGNSLDNSSFGLLTQLTPGEAGKNQSASVVPGLVRVENSERGGKPTFR